MADGDNLGDLLALARQEMPDVPAEIWERFAALASANFGASRIYVASQKKRKNLEALAALDESMEIEKVAHLLGLSVRRVQQLKRLR